jgi:hypothetical protein
MPSSGLNTHLGHHRRVLVLVGLALGDWARAERFVSDFGSVVFRWR